MSTIAAKLGALARNIPKSFSFAGKTANMWRCDNHKVLLRCWDDACVAYHIESGDTHLLTAVSGQVLQMLLANPAATHELTQALLTPVDEADMAGEVLEDTLRQLSHLGLIEALA